MSLLSCVGLEGHGHPSTDMKGRVERLVLAHFDWAADLELAITVYVHDHLEYSTA